MHNDVTRMGDVIRHAREAKNMTQAVLAEKTESSIRTIIAVENDKRYPTYEIFYRIIHALDISADLVFYPDKVPYTLEQDQMIRKFLSCGESEQKIVMATVHALIHVLRKNEDNDS